MDAEQKAPAETARRRKTRDRLLDAAFEVFAEQGLHAASVERIAEHAGFTRGAFYSNFVSKEELFFALSERESSRGLERMREGFDLLFTERPITPGDLTLDTLTDIVGLFLQHHRDDRQWLLLHTEFRLLAMRNPVVALRYHRFIEDIRAQFAEVLTTALASVGMHFTHDPLVITRLLDDAYEAAVQEWALLPAEERAPNALDQALLTVPLLVHAFTEPIPETGGMTETA